VRGTASHFCLSRPALGRSTLLNAEQLQRLGHLVGGTPRPLSLRQLHIDEMSMRHAEHGISTFARYSEPEGKELRALIRRQALTGD
jgi:hypothetical protein